jgi:peptidoglycan L-alanyl-D-glutamate endopeptidase CwlK
VKIDKTTTTRLRSLYPDVSTRAIRLFNDVFIQHGRSLRITEGFRTFARQRKLHAIGRTTPGKVVTNAEAGESFHNYGIALDVCFRGKDPYLEKDPHGVELWKELGRFAKGHGFVWGGDFSYLVDRPHLQLTFGLTLPEIQALYKFGETKAVWAKFDTIRQVEVASEWEGVHTKVKLLKP